MSPLDEELRRTLQRRADDVPPPAAVLAGVHGRARSLRRRRTAGRLTGALAAVALVAVAVPLVDDLRAGGDVARVAVAPTPSPGATDGTAATGPVNAIPFDAQGRPTNALDWPARGDLTGQPLADAYNALLDEFATRNLTAPAEVDGSVLYSVSDRLGEALVVQLWIRGVTPAHLVVGLPADGTGPLGAAFDDIVAPGAVQVSAVLPGDELPRVLVVARPTGIGDILYAPGGDDFAAVGQEYVRGDAVRLFPRTWDPAGPADQVMVLDGDGNLDDPLYAGPLTYDGTVQSEPPPGTEPTLPTVDGTAGPAATSQAGGSGPDQAALWPYRGLVPVREALLDPAVAAYRDSTPGADRDLAARPLYGADSDNGTAFLLTLFTGPGTDPTVSLYTVVGSRPGRQAVTWPAVTVGDAIVVVVPGDPDQDPGQPPIDLLVVVSELKAAITYDGGQFTPVTEQGDGSYLSALQDGATQSVTIDHPDGRRTVVDSPFDRAG